MGHNAADEQDAPGEIDLRDEAILVASNVEDDERSHEVGRIERLFNVGEARPVGASSHAVPMVQRLVGVGMLLTEDPDRLVADNMHEDQSDGPIMGPTLSLAAF